MAITNDAFGNYYIGNFITGDLVDWTEVLSCFRQALGSDDRANINGTTNINITRIDWRPNLIEETLTGVIEIPGANSINTNPNLGVSGYTLTANSRQAFAYNNTVSNNLAGTTFLNQVAFANGTSNQVATTSRISFLSTDSIWLVASKQNISFFVYRNPTTFYFFSSGFLLYSGLSYPDNAYTIITLNNQIISKGFSSSSLKSIHTFGTKANHDHTKLSDGLTTQSETELYLRDASTDIPYGYVPNIFKWKVDGNEEVKAIGDVVRLNMANAAGEYTGQGNMFCKVVGRLGSTSNTDLTGDYLLMKIAN
jgi:hypothetical protein